MNIHTQVSHHVVTGIVSTFERLTNVWRTRASEQNSVPSSWPDRFDMTALLHDNAPRDASRVFPRKSGAPCQEPTCQNQPGLRAYRPSPAARFDRIRQLRTSLSGFITRSNRRAEEAIHDPATDGLKPVLDIVPAAAIVVDEAHTVVLANELAATLFGYTKEELGSLSFVQLFPRMADDEQDGRGSFAASTAGDGLAGSGERRTAIARCKDGSERAVGVKCTQYGEAGASLWIVTSVNLCGQEEAWRDDPQHGHLTRVFELAEMAAVLAHEINQPLTAILSNAQAVQRFPELTQSASTDLREAFADIVADSFRATEIVRKLRQFVKRAAPEMRSLDIGNLVSGVMHLMRRDAVVRGVSVTLDIARFVPTIRGDNIQLQQVMINLLQNAFDAVQGCCAENRMVSVKVDTAPQGEGVSITVSDRGPGLKADQIGEVFTPFSTSKPHGLGLGLSISISIISMHGGHLWAESNGDRGATFRVLLPSVGEAEGSAPSQTS